MYSCLNQKIADKKIDKILKDPKILFDSGSKNHKTEIDDDEIQNFVNDLHSINFDDIPEENLKHIEGNHYEIINDL